MENDLVGFYVRLITQSRYVVEDTFGSQVPSEWKLTIIGYQLWNFRVKNSLKLSKITPLLVVS